MKKVLALVLVLVIVLSVAASAVALENANDGWEKKLPALSGDSGIVVFYSLEDVKNLSEEQQKLVDEATDKLGTACPENHVLRYFALVEIAGSENVTDITLKWIEHEVMLIKQYVNGKWISRDHTVNEDNTIAVNGITNGPIAIFTNNVDDLGGETGEEDESLLSAEGKAEDLLPDISEDSSVLVLLHSTEMVADLTEAIQAQMKEAKAKLKDACPDGFAVKFFFYVEILGNADTASVVFENLDFEEIVFAQYIDGEWVELSYELNGDGTVTVKNVVNGPKAIFIK